jgi:hypothetical protein
MAHLILTEKLEDLRIWAMRAFEPSNTDTQLNNARKCGEALCKAMLVQHYGTDRGSRLIAGTERLDGANSKPNHQSLNSLSRLVTSDGADPVFPDRDIRQQVFSQLESIRVHSNPQSHDRSTIDPTFSAPALRIALVNVASLLHFFYETLIDQPLPQELELYVRQYAGVELKQRVDYEDVRGHDIVRLYYPNQALSDHKETVAKERVSYEYVEVEAAKSNRIGFLFVKKHINIRNTLRHFFERHSNTLNNLTICSPRITNREDGKAIDRLAGIAEAYQELQLPSLPKSVEYYYTDDFIWRFCLSKHADVLSTPVETEGCFVDQELHAIEDDHDVALGKDCLDHIRTLIESPEADHPLHLIAGPAGVGKTTLCKQLVHVINSKFKKKRALFISATDLRDAETDSVVESIADLYRLYVKVNGLDGSDVLEGQNLEINISCGNIVLIIDGLDEIESTLKNKFNLDAFLKSATALNESYRNCVLIITIRDFYLSQYRGTASIAIYRLRGFTEAAVSTYLKKRFPDQRHIESAIQLLKGIEFRDDEYLFPLYLSLICDIVETELELPASQAIQLLGVSDSLYFHPKVTIDRLVYDLLRREIAKQSLQISCDQYFELLMEIAVEYSGMISQDSLNEYIELSYSLVKPTSEDARKKYRQIYVSPLLIHLESASAFRIKYSVVETWVKARYVTFCFKKRKGGPNLFKLLAEMHYGRSELLDELVKTLRAFRHDFLEYGRVLLTGFISECRRVKSNENLMAVRRQISGLVYLVLSGNQLVSKGQYTEQLISLYSGLQFDYLSAFGEFFPLDFTGCRVRRGWFERYTHFGKCTFPVKGTVFFETTFINVDPGMMRSSNIELFDDLSPLDEKLRSVIDRGRATANENLEELRSDMQRVLKVGFRAGGFLWKSEAIYRKVTLRMGVPLDEFLGFFVKLGVLQKVPAREGKAHGYIVAPPFRPAVKNLLENSALSIGLEKVAMVALTEYYSP